MTQLDSAKRPGSAAQLFDCWREVAASIRRAKHLLLLLDFDGTLVRFHRNPKDVRLDEATRNLLMRLARNPRIMVAFISGRRRADLRRRVNVPGARYWGLHGWENSPGIRLNGSSRRTLLTLKRALEPALRRLPEVWLDDKQAALALHYRGASPEAARRALAAVRKVFIALKPRVRILRGKKILELLPPEVEGKGAIVRKLVDGAPQGALAIYIGDDATDETAFEALRQGLTVRVGERNQTRARFRLRSPDDVRRFLERLEAEGLMR